jgi:hypothetical protein
MALGQISGPPVTITGTSRQGSIGYNSRKKKLSEMDHYTVQQCSSAAVQPFSNATLKFSIDYLENCIG